MLKLDTPIQYLKGVGPKMAKKLARVSVNTVNDLIYYFPRTWNDLSKITPINYVRIGEVYNIRAKIKSISNVCSPRKKINITSAILRDKDGEIKAVWFNQPFLIKNLQVGDTWIFSGKIEWDFQTNFKIMVSPVYEKKSAIFAIYPEIEGITSKYLRRLIMSIFEKKPLITDFLLPSIIKNQKLLTLEEAIYKIHFPANQNDILLAKKRLAFDELFIIALKIALARKDFEIMNAPCMEVKVDILTQFIKNLPYKLTNAQRKSAWEIIKDTTKTVPMNRLLEGDVGSGKTVVACIATLNVIKNNYQVIWMAPTELLALQHFNNVSHLLKNFNVDIALFSSSLKIRNCDIKNQKLKSRNKKIPNMSKLLSADLIIGTHALIQEKIKFNNPGLIIIDEQHRFGVKQRAALIKNAQSNFVPHFLSMTATPIPRTLALSLYGDLDFSILNEMPPGKPKIITKIVDPVNREKAYEFIRREMQKRHQVFVICPLIEVQKSKLKNKNLFETEKKSVLKEYEKLSKEIFPEYKIAMLHGKMKSKEKEKIMNNFKKGKTDLLVSTSVIEVGIDVPNATVMMIEDSEKFGLAQLHQFRGRIGRGKEQSYCFLFTESLSPETNKRLKALEECSDGFKLAEKDLEFRGPGEFVGTLQHGLPDLKMASLTDTILIKNARQEAEKIVKAGIENYPLIFKKIHNSYIENHLE